MLNRREFLALGASSIALPATAVEDNTGFVTPQQFGARAIGERFDDGRAIQRAIDYAWRHPSVSQVRFPAVDAFYNIRYPIVCRPGISLIADRARIKNLNEEGFLERSIFLPGNFHPDFTEKLDYFEIRPTDIADTFRFKTEADGRRFKPGAQVFITSIEYDLTGGLFKVPEFGWLNKIVKSGNGLIQVEHHLDKDIAAYKIALLGSPARDDIPLFYYSDAEIKGFDVETSGHWISDSACHNVRISNNTVKSKTAIYGNTYQNVLWTNNIFQSRNAFSEQSHNSLNTIASGNTFTRVASDDEPFVGFSFQEFARNIVVKNNVASVGRCEGKRGPMVWYLNAAGIKVIDLQVSIGFFGGTSVVGFGRRGATTTFRQEMNALVDSNFNVGSCGRYVEANGFDSEFIEKNRIENCIFDGGNVVAEGMRFVDNTSPFPITATKWKGKIFVRGVAPKIS